MADGGNLPLFDYAATVWRRKLMVLLIVTALTVPAVVVSLLQAPVYEAAAVVGVSEPAVSSDGSIQSGSLSDTQMRTQTALINGDSVEILARQRGATGTVTASLSGQSNVFSLSGRGPSAEAVAQSVNVYAQAYIDVRNRARLDVLDIATQQLENRISDLQRQIAGAPASSAAALGTQLSSLQGQLGRIDLERAIAGNSATLITAAVPPTTPIQPQPFRNAALAVVLGLALGIVAAILLEATRRRRGGTTSSVDMAGAPGVEGADRPTNGAAQPSRTDGFPPRTGRGPAVPSQPLPSMAPGSSDTEASTVTMQRRGLNPGQAPRRP